MSIEFPPELVAMREHANRTPDTGEGSTGHSRSDFAWTVEDDYRRAVNGDRTLLDDFVAGYGFDRIKQACINDATSALKRWTEEDSWL